MMIDKSHIAQDQIPKPKPVYRRKAGRRVIFPELEAVYKPVEMDDIMKALMKQPAQECPSAKPIEARQTEPILTQAEIKSLIVAPEKPAVARKNRARRKTPQVVYQLPAKDTWRSAFCDVTIIAGCVVLLLLIADVGVIGYAGYKFSVGILQKAEQWQAKEDR